MSRPLQITAISGTYLDGTNLLPIIQTTIAADLSSIGITGVGLPQIFVQGIVGTSNAAITLKLSNYSKIKALQNLQSSLYGFDVGVYNDNIFTTIDKITIATATPSASANITLNCYYEPVATL